MANEWANLTPAQTAAKMAQYMQQAGLPAELPVMAGLVESGLKNLNYGDRDSQGYFQMRTGIWNTGKYKGYVQNPELQMQWFLDQAKAVRKQWSAQGKELAPGTYGEFVADIERPAEQYRGRYQQRLSEARNLLSGANVNYAATGSPTSGSPTQSASGTTGQLMPQGQPGTNTTNQGRAALMTYLQERGQTPYGQQSNLMGKLLSLMPKPLAQRYAPQTSVTDTSLNTQQHDPGTMQQAWTGSILGGSYKLGGGPNDHGARAFGNWQSDNAYDLLTPVGTPIYAVAGGVIDSRFGSLGNSGKTAGLRLTVNGADNRFFYHHLSKYAPGIKPGVRVKPGQLIGYSGEAVGVPHLHFGVEKGDPKQYIK